jgi:hypothetical protein
MERLGFGERAWCLKDMRPPVVFAAAEIVSGFRRS